MDRYYFENEPMDTDVSARIYTRNTGNDDCRYPMHWHDDVELDLVIRGKIIGKIGSQSFIVNEGDFFFANSGELHETDAVDYQTLRTVTVLISYRMIKQYFPNITNYKFDLSDKPLERRKIADLLRQCGDEENQKGELKRLTHSILVRQIVEILLKNCRIEKENNSEINNKYLCLAKKAIAFMEEHYSEELPLERIANELSLTPNYFSRYFKTATNTTFLNYLTNIRLYHGYNQLRTTEKSVSEIAQASGFPNVKSFIEAFKHSYNTTPDRYRKSFLKDY